MTSYLTRPQRVNGQAKKKPGLFKRIIMGIIPWKGDDVGTIIRKAVFLIALVAFIITAVPLVSDVFQMVKDDVVSKNQMKNLYVPGNTGGTGTGNDDEYEPPRNPDGTLMSFDKLRAENSETVGYIKIDGTPIDYPVVQHADNDYYLDHDFWGNYSKSGTIMMDYRNVVSKDGNSTNLVLYGHHMAIGTYFARLNEYWRTLYDSYTDPSMSMYKEHPVITFNTIYEESQWKIFAIGLYNTTTYYGEVYPYNNTHNFASKEAFNDFIIDIMDRSDIFTDVDVQYGDDILTLSTCCWPFSDNGRQMDNARLAIFARKVRPGESLEVDVDKATVNHNVYRWEWVYKRIYGWSNVSQAADGTWSPANINDYLPTYWDRRKLLSYTAEEAEADGYTFPED